MSQLDSEVLKINKNWSPVSIISVKQAFLDAFAGAVTLLRFQDGYPTIYRASDWLDLHVEDGEDFVPISGRFQDEIRKIPVPRVCICTSYDKLLAKSQPCNPNNLLKRYGHRDAVTGRPLSRENFSKEHVRPRSKGGDNSWGNIVPMDKRANSRRGNTSYRKAGLKAPKVLGAPRPLLPINQMINRNSYPEWDFFHISR